MGIAIWIIGTAIMGFLMSPFLLFLRFLELIGINLRF